MLQPRVWLLQTRRRMAGRMSRFYQTTSRIGRTAAITTWTQTRRRGAPWSQQRRVQIPSRPKIIWNQLKIKMVRTITWVADERAHYVYVAEDLGWLVDWPRRSRFRLQLLRGNAGNCSFDSSPFDLHYIKLKNTKNRIPVNWRFFLHCTFNIQDIGKTYMPVGDSEVCATMPDSAKDLEGVFSTVLSPSTSSTIASVGIDSLSTLITVSCSNA